MSGSTSVQKGHPVVIPFTEQELELMGINLETARQQFANIQDFGQFQQRLFETVAPALQKLGFASQQTPEEQQFLQQQAQRNQGLEAQRSGFLQSQLGQQQGILDAGGQVTAADKALLDKMQAQAVSDVRLGTEKNLAMIRNQLAPSLGLRPSDAPNLDRGGLVAAEGLRQEGQIAAARAAQELALPQQRLASFAAASAPVDAAQQFAQSLRQGDFQNQLAFLGQTTQSGLGLAGIGADSGLQAAIKPIVATDSSSKSKSGGI